MTHFIQFEANDGHTIIFEVDDSTTSGMREVSRGSQVIKATKSLEQSLQVITPVVNSIFKTLGAAVKPPEELEVELGLTMNAEAGAVIAKTSVEGSIKLTLKWKRPEAEK